MINRTPFEIWYDHKPSISHFKVFGCIYYVKIPKVKGTKFDSKAILALHIGHNEQSKGYRLYALESNKVIVSRDVSFNEN